MRTWKVAIQVGRLKSTNIPCYYVVNPRILCI